MLDDSVGKLKRLQADVAASLRDDSHTGGPTQATVPLDRAGRFLHFWGLVGRFFWRNRCQVRASALAYTTLLALVPLLAVSLTVASLVFDAKSDASRQKLTGMIERLVDNVAPTLGLSDADGSAPVGPPPRASNPSMLPPHAGPTSPKTSSISSETSISAPSASRPWSA